MAVDHNNPQSRDEEILIATIDGKEYDKAPQSRMEELLLELKETIEEGGGGGGTTNYENLSNQPQVNGETLIGDKTGADLGLVDAEEGKGLSTNDYDDTEKAAVAAATSAISGMLDGSDIDSFGDVETALSAIKDGSELDSFGDVEVALLDKADTSDLGTAADKDSTNAVTSGSTDLVESGAVKDAIDAAVAAAYHHAGTKTVAQLTHDLLIAANEGNVYNITDSGTTTSDFIEGIGKQIDAGDNVGICKVGDVYMFDLLSGLEDTSIFVQKSQTAGLLKNDGTVNDEIEGDIDSLKSGLINQTARSRSNITSRLTNLATAVAEQNLEKYGYKIGDYFTGASGYTYHLADMDTFYGGYNNNAIVNTHHVSLVVKTGTNSKWAETNNTSGGYKTSTLHNYLSSTVLDNIKSDMIALFGGSTGLEHLISHKLLWTTATSGASAWSDNVEYISALSEPQVYGTNVWAIDGYQTGEAWKWLEIFHKFNFCEILGNMWWWLRSISSASGACAAGAYGDARYSGASASGGAVGLIIFH